MATAQRVLDVQSSNLQRLAEGRLSTDSLFSLLPPNSFYDRPITERHRLIFYLGHLEAFDWNLLAGPLGLSAGNPEFDKLFAFGIDPVGGGLPTDTPDDWPNIAEVDKYGREARSRLDGALHAPGSPKAMQPGVSIETLLQVAIEHRLMHAETMAYLLHNLPPDRKIAAPHSSRLVESSPPQQRQAAIPAGIASLGQDRDSNKFGWDNEFEKQQIEVPSFSIDVFPVTNEAYLEFVRAGGYDEPSYWRPEDWKWRFEQRIEYPAFWTPRSQLLPSDPGMRWQYRTMFGAIPLPLSWPVYVSQAEASAFAHWSGKQLPTEAQWHRAAYGAPEGNERAYPWGDAAPSPEKGNFHHQTWDPMPVDSHPAGSSAFGVHDLLGNGWEWTRTPFGPLPGFEPFPFYPGYSANFFDGKHYVMKGGSGRTDACMLRRSFRNWFQPRYPYIYATFRCVEA